MQESFRHRLSPVLDHDSDDADSKTVHQNRDRDAGEKDYRLFPQRALEEIGAHEREDHQRKEITQPVAGLHDLKLVRAEIDDVAFEINADIAGPNERDTECRGKELKFARQALIEKIGQRNRKKQKEQRYPDLSEYLGPGYRDLVT